MYTLGERERERERTSLQALPKEPVAAASLGQAGDLLHDLT